MGTAMTLRKVSIQGPGLGSQAAHPGMQQSKSQGSAMPKPSARKTASASAAGCVTAKPSAAPIKGAVQGLATMTASMPVRKELRRPFFGFFDIATPPRDDPAVNSKSPARLSVMAANRSIRSVMTQGACS